jgi:hypothetical protein
VILTLSVQLETVLLNCVSTHNLVETLIHLVLKFSGDVQQRRQDNEYLKHHLKISASARASAAVNVKSI